MTSTRNEGSAAAALADIAPRAASDRRPQLSIVTVARNSAAHIAQTISSVIAQNISDLQYVVIDGASSDNTVEVVMRFRERLGNQLIVLSEPDNGIYEAMNKGIGLATGRIIGILNSDDTYLPGSLRAVLARFARGDVDLVYGDVLVETPTGDRVVASSASGLSSAMSILHPGCFVGRWVYERWGPFDTTLRIAADYEFLLRVRKHGARFAHVDQVLTRFAASGASARSFRLAREMWIVHRRYFSASHAAKHAAIRVASAAFYGARRTVIRGLVGPERYELLRARIRRGSQPPRSQPASETAGQQSPRE